MNAAIAAARVLADVLVAPGAAWRRLAGAPPVAWLCVWVAALHAALAAAHGHNAWAALRDEMQDGIEATRSGIVLARVSMVAVVPLWTVARAFVLAVLLGATARALQRRRVALALAIEAVPVLESTALAAATAAARPGDIDALRAVQLHAGLDFFWRPHAAWAAAFLGAANAFSVWWLVLFVTGAVRVLDASWRRAAAVGSGVWVLRVIWRAAWMSPP